MNNLGHVRLIDNEDFLSRFISQVVWKGGWDTRLVVCPACNHEFVLMKPIGRNVDTRCPECKYKIGEGWLNKGDGLWFYDDPSPVANEMLYFQEPGPADKTWMSVN